MLNPHSLRGAPVRDRFRLAGEAGEDCGETGEVREAGVLSTSEPEDIAALAALGKLPSISAKRRRVPRLPLPA